MTAIFSLYYDQNLKVGVAVWYMNLKNIVMEEESYESCDSQHKSDLYCPGGN